MQRLPPPHYGAPHPFGGPPPFQEPYIGPRGHGAFRGNRGPVWREQFPPRLPMHRPWNPPRPEFGGQSHFSVTTRPTFHDQPPPGVVDQRYIQGNG